MKLTKEEINDAIAKTRARMVALNINPDLLAPQVIPNRIDAPGNVKAGQSSCDRYHAAMLSFRNFCYCYGDYDSAMMLNHTCIPFHCWTVNLNTTRIFLRYQCMENGLDLKHPDTNAPVPWPNHPTGQCMKSIGVWTSSSSINIFGAALRMYNTTIASGNEPFIDICSECVKLKKACPHHAHIGPRYSRCGNICDDHSFKLNQSNMIEYVKRYVSRKTKAFYPNELRKMRTALITRNSICDLMAWVMVIVGTMQCFRADEVVTITVDQFVSRCFGVRDGSIDHLMLWVNGKSDEGPVHMLMHDRDCDDCPEFSNVRMVLLWVHVTGVKSGYLFPSLAQLRNRDAQQGIYTEHYDFKLFLNDIKYLSYNILGLAPSKKELISKYSNI